MNQFSIKKKEVMEMLITLKFNYFSIDDVEYLGW